MVGLTALNEVLTPRGSHERIDNQLSLSCLEPTARENNVVWFAGSSTRPRIMHAA